MRSVIGLSAFALAAAFAVSASAQMYGGGMQMAQAQTSRPQAQAQGTPAEPRRTGMCGCCQNMAMMQGMMGRSTGAQGQQTMPGMNMPGMQMPGMQMPAPGDAKPSEPPKQP